MQRSAEHKDRPQRDARMKRVDLPSPDFLGGPRARYDNLPRRGPEAIGWHESLEACGSGVDSLGGRDGQAQVKAACEQEARSGCTAQEEVSEVKAADARSEGAASFAAWGKPCLPIARLGVRSRQTNLAAVRTSRSSLLSFRC